MSACSAPPARTGSASGGRFFDSKLGVFASPRLVADGEAVPRGGGTYLVGKPYTIGGRAYYPSERPDGYTATGTASWYGDAFHGRRTANGEIFDKNSISAAHPTLPLPSYVRVTNMGNGRSMIVRVNDRGPYHGGRVMDVSQRVAEALNFRSAGTARIKVEYVSRAGLRGSDDDKLMATLRTDGAPAEATMLASDDPSDGPVPGAPTRQPFARADRMPRAEDEDAPEGPPEPVPQRRHYAAPVPPLRPFDVSLGEPAAPGVSERSRIHPDKVRQAINPAPRFTPPALVSFAPTPPVRVAPRPVSRQPDLPAWQDAQSEN